MTLEFETFRLSPHHREDLLNLSHQLIQSTSPSMGSYLVAKNQPKQLQSMISLLLGCDSSDDLNKCSHLNCKFLHTKSKPTLPIKKQ
ncbi:unnamed protein product [Dovyalis caffra]|uniref:Uncharacterized protein n=1 Tax=Dovyalis caffra TaxID=77055 RepID=A0AAV1RPR8_9ROSI|nr:unnamed protein product [Dovyalis caffra]